MRIFKSKCRTVKFCLIIFLLILMLTGCHAFKPTSVPKPSDGFYSGDFADVITPETERYICSYASALEKLTGSQIVIVTVSELHGAAIDRYASDIFNSWGIGSSKENNGVLLVMAVAEEQYWIIQGAGLKEYLSSGVLKSMLNESLEPYFAERDYDSGAKNMFDAIYSKLCSYYSVVPQTESLSGTSGNSSESASGIFFNLLLAAAILIIVIIFVRRIFKGAVRRSRHRRNRRSIRQYGTHTVCASHHTAENAEHRRNSIRQSDMIHRTGGGLYQPGIRPEKLRKRDDFTRESDSCRRTVSRTDFSVGGKSRDGRSRRK